MSTDLIKYQKDWQKILPDEYSNATVGFVEQIDAIVSMSAFEPPVLMVDYADGDIGAMCPREDQKIELKMIWQDQDNRPLCKAHSGTRFHCMLPNCTLECARYVELRYREIYTPISDVNEGDTFAYCNECDDNTIELHGHLPFLKNHQALIVQCECGNKVKLNITHKATVS